LLFNKSKSLEAKIDEYLDAINNGMLVFHLGLQDYLDKNDKDFAERIVQIDKYENEADVKRREIENQLYSHSLVPEHRGDVLGLLESLDNVIDTAKETLFQFDVEIPEIPKQFNDSFIKLSNFSVKAAEAIVASSRAFFNDLNSVKNHIHKVYFFEKEADKTSNELKREIFRTDLRLSHKIHLRYFAYHVEQISDRAEDVADRLSIYTIKREI
jgi:predicted phosphate transport protein (TIGR00153 family)